MQNRIIGKINSIFGWGLIWIQRNQNLMLLLTLIFKYGDHLQLWMYLGAIAWLITLWSHQRLLQSNHRVSMWLEWLLYSKTSCSSNLEMCCASMWRVIPVSFLKTMEWCCSIMLATPVSCVVWKNNSNTQFTDRQLPLPSWNQPRASPTFINTCSTCHLNINSDHLLFSSHHCFHPITASHPCHGSHRCTCLLVFLCHWSHSAPAWWNA